MILEPNDLIITTYYPIRVGGWDIAIPNGVKVYHKPSGLENRCSSERSQHRNRAICVDRLKEQLINFVENSKGMGI